MAANRVIGVDVGGTKVLAGIVDPSGTVHEAVERPTTTTSQAALLDEIAGIVRPLLAPDVAAVGFGVPARVDQKTGVVEGAVNIPITEVSFRDEMERRLGVPVGVENDANAATYAEFRLGAGRDVDSFVMLTLGTGVGGGVVIDGALYRGWAEFGHVVIVADGEPCPGNCTGRGHVEAYCAGPAADKIARELLGPQASARDLIAQKHPALDGVGHYLGIAIGSLINIFNPELVAIGGGFGVAGFDVLLPAARPAVVREALAPSGSEIDIRRAELGFRAGLIGAGLVAFDAVR